MGEGGEGVEMLISEITESILDYSVQKKNVMLIFNTCYLSFKYLGIYYTNTGSDQITGI